MSLNRPDAVAEQYRDSSHLGARADLHARFSTNPYGWMRWVFDRLEAVGFQSALEVGCGPAWLWRPNLGRVPAGARVVASDMSAGMAAEARAAVTDPRFRFLVADAQRLPFADGRFDVVVANHMLYHVPDVDRALTEFERVLAPRGTLLAATNGQGHMPELRALLDTTWRYIDAFGLESGPGIVGRHFDDVTVERYDDALEVTEAGPVMDYVRSMSSFRTSAGGKREGEVRRKIQAAIDRDGAFRIEKEAGLITARRRS